MNERNWQVLFAVSLAAVGYMAYARYQDDDRAKRASVDLAAATERAKRGPFVESEQILPGGERLRLVAVPNSYGEMFDQMCLLYTSPDLKTAAITCLGDRLSAHAVDVDQQP